MDLENKPNTLHLINAKKSTEALYTRICSYINKARQAVQRSIDTEMVKAYWHIGREIVEEEQKGEKRAEYGRFLLKMLAGKLTQQYKRGFSVSTLRDIRQFYLTYSNNESIHHALRGELEKTFLPQQLGWLHYRILMRIQHPEARQFYKIEAIKNNWSGRELERQVKSFLFERLLKSKDKAGVMDLVNKGQSILKPEDAFKEPIILEFLGLPESHRLVESKLEEALITHLQTFMLELGKGFAFIARQKRITLENDHFYCDLVFYHVILKCYVIIDVKTRKLTHADLGQMQLYVNYFDREIKMENDNPTLGLILCPEKNTSMVQYTLDEKVKQIFASQYQFHLPTEDELKAELNREMALLEETFERDTQE